MRDPELEMARSVERSYGGAHDAHMTFSDDVTQPLIATTIVVIDHTINLKPIVSITWHTPMRNLKAIRS